MGFSDYLFFVMEMRGLFAIIRLFVSIQIKDISIEICGWFLIILIFVSVQIKDTKNARTFRYVLR